ncbi:MAG: hemerythrin family protein [Candidatus Marinimicrobia bacterium]|nr:hemerythrin family protein [Candidatus Neomarinimicrobiota bacterium]MBT3896778.1 hemerythrin family protein [Candidatus Neomarinimicrobiota bacterium]MBT4173928.1 hemerythrin family protein [Candidatus Neomarinimicrobiota bacterium]MBT7884625.1 hemerythrin family protein [Candidatus Neomarinimicrobiota bacterium]
MSIRFTWEKSLSVGNDLLDEQHKNIIELACQLPEIIVANDTPSVINQLYKYFRFHFSHEEEMMRSINFPFLGEHQLIHEGFISKLNKIRQQTIDSNLSLSRNKMLIYEWMVEHIMCEDKKYFHFIREQN